MLINYVPGEECRIAIARDGRLEEFYQERASAESHVGNIYKGRVVNVESSIQAAFIDFGLERNGFLHITDLHPMYFPGKDREEFEKVGSKTPHRQRPPIQRCLSRGQEVLVQVLKEGLGTKGPTLTSYLSIPGRFLVMMPQMERLGVSRKVDDDDARREAKKTLAGLNPPEGFGFIVRTAGIGQTKTDLKRDLAYLQRLWKNIERRRKQIGKVGELYTESDLVIRTIRDVFSKDISRIIIDDPTAARRAHDFLTIASPRSRSKVLYYNDGVPLFHRFDIERQIESIHAREVPLPSGGSLVIDQTEALVAVDVNSGKSRQARDAETNAFNTDKEAVDEIARQLRLRDLGGVVVLDLIDMRDQKHRRQIEQRFRNNLKKDRARSRIGSISQFGTLELTRQRMRPSLNTSVYATCEHCEGLGQVKSPESVVLEVMRRLALGLQHDRVARVELTISPDVAFQLLNRKRDAVVDLERRYEKKVLVRVGGHSVDHLKLDAYDERGGQVEVDTLVKPGSIPRETDDTYVDLSAGEEPPEPEEEVTPAKPEGQPSQPVPAEQLQKTQQRPGEDQGDEQEEEESGKRRRRRRRRRGRRKRSRGGNGGEQQAQDEKQDQQVKDRDQGEQKQPGREQEGKSRQDAKPEQERQEAEAQTGGDAEGDTSAEQDGQKKSRRSRNRRGRGRKKQSDAPDQARDESAEAKSEKPEKARKAEVKSEKSDEKPGDRGEQKAEKAVQQDDSGQGEQPGKSDKDQAGKTAAKTEKAEKPKSRRSRGGRRKKSASGDGGESEESKKQPEAEPAAASAKDKSEKSDPSEKPDKGGEAGKSDKPDQDEPSGGDGGGNGKSRRRGGRSRQGAAAKGGRSGRGKKSDKDQDKDQEKAPAGEAKANGDGGGEKAPAAEVSGGYSNRYTGAATGEGEATS